MGFFATLKSLFKNKENSKATFTDTTIEEIDPILTKKTEIGLTPGEIILLDWCDGTPRDRLFPQYFKYTYNINGRKSVENLLKEDFLEYGVYENELASLTVKVLKTILSDNNIIPKGRKENLVDQVIEADINVKDLPKVYILTFKGRETVRDYEHIVLAHKDKFFDVVSVISYREKLTYPYGYGDLKWAYLGDQTMIHTKEQNFGLLRNTHLARADHLEREKKYSSALSEYIVVVLFDLSGLSNSYKYHEQPFYEDVDVRLEMFKGLEKVIDKGLLTKDEYNEAFSKAQRFFASAQSLSFLSNKDITFLKERIYNLDNEAIEKYLRKYKDMTYEKYAQQERKKWLD